MDKYQHIVFDKNILGGKPILKGTRISVELILEWLANGSSVDQIALAYPHLNKEAIKEAILYANEISKNQAD
jgi:uncharacterized protein (DUF433 family)